MRHAAIAAIILLLAACDAPKPSPAPSQTPKVSARPAASQPAPYQGSRVTLGDKTIEAPPGAAVEMTVTERRDNSGHADGGRVDVLGEKIDNKVAGTPGHLSLGADDEYGVASGESGGITANSTATAIEKRGSQIALYVIGAILVAAGVAIGWLTGNIKLALGAGLAGLAVIGCGVLIDVYPWVFLVGLAALIAVGAWIAWDYIAASRKGKATGEALATHETALESVTAGVADIKKLGARLAVDADGKPLSFKQVYDYIKTRVAANTDDDVYAEVFDAIDAAKERAGAVSAPEPLPPQ